MMLWHLPLIGFMNPIKYYYVGITIQALYPPGMFGVEDYCRGVLNPTPVPVRMGYIIKVVIFRFDITNGVDYKALTICINVHFYHQYLLSAYFG